MRVPLFCALYLCPHYRRGVCVVANSRNHLCVCLKNVAAFDVSRRARVRLPLGKKCRSRHSARPPSTFSANVRGIVLLGVKLCVSSPTGYVHMCVLFFSRYCCTRESSGKLSTLDLTLERNSLRNLFRGPRDRKCTLSARHGNFPRRGGTLLYGRRYSPRRVISSKQ